MEQKLFELLTHYGSPLLFFALFLGILGLPIPDEFLLTLSGALVRRGDLSSVPTLVAAICGSVGGITLSYVLGRTVGILALRRVLHVSDETLARLHRWFDRLGRWLLTFGYFIPGVRHVTAIAAGSAPLEYRSFATFAYPGAVLWCVGFLSLGYFEGPRWEHAITHVRGARLWLAAIAIVAGAVAWFAFARRERTTRDDDASEQL